MSFERAGVTSIRRRQNDGVIHSWVMVTAMPVTIRINGLSSDVVTGRGPRVSGLEARDAFRIAFVMCNDI